MRVPEGVLRDAIEATVTDWAATEHQQEVIRSTCRSFVRALGIEIVPDPEPELPPKPWTVSVLPNRLEILDGEQRVIFLYGRLPNETLGKEFAIFNALVAAYNAAGERKRVELRRSGAVWLAGPPGEDLSADGASKWSALGWYVWNHAGDLGLEIVEP